MKKTKQKHYAFNTHLLFGVAFFIIILAFSIFSAVEGEIGLSIGFAAFTLLPIFAFFVSPLYIVFSDEEIKIIYVAGQREVIKWDSIRCISLYGSWIARNAQLPHYAVAYRTNEKRLFFVNGEIPKTRKTKKYIEQYYRKNIEFSDNIKKSKK